MELEKIKERMKNYRDFYGGDLLGVDEIDGAKTKEELAKIIDRHNDHMESMLSDAQGHLERFKRKIGLNYY